MKARPQRDPFRFEPALQERVEHSKFELTQQLGPHDPEEAALDVDEGVFAGERPPHVLAVAEPVERWIPLDPELRAAQARTKRRRRWGLRAAAAGAFASFLLWIAVRR